MTGFFARERGSHQPFTPHGTVSGLSCLLGKSSLLVIRPSLSLPRLVSYRGLGRGGGGAGGWLAKERRR